MSRPPSSYPPIEFPFLKNKKAVSSTFGRAAKEQTVSIDGGALSNNLNTVPTRLRTRDTLFTRALWEQEEEEADWLRDQKVPHPPAAHSSFRGDLFEPVEASFEGDSDGIPGKDKAPSRLNYLSSRPQFRQ